MMAAPSPPVMAYRAAQSIAILSVGDDSQWNDCGCFSTLKCQLALCSRTRSLARFGFEALKFQKRGRKREREKERLNSSAHIAMQFLVNMSPFQLVFEPSKCPSASTETSVRSKKTSVRSKKKKKQKNSKKKVRRKTERRRQQQRGGKFQRASLMFFSYTRINYRYGLAI